MLSSVWAGVVHLEISKMLAAHIHTHSNAEAKQSTLMVTNTQKQGKLDFCPLTLFYLIFSSCEPVFHSMQCEKKK